MNNPLRLGVISALADEQQGLVHAMQGMVKVNHGMRDYMAGNLLGREVTADDVAQAFLAQALALKTTADVTTVDGGNIAAALR